MESVIIGLINAVICIFALKGAIKRTSKGCCGSGGKDEKKIRCKDKNKEHYPYQCEIEVSGMVCGNCVKHLENAFHASDNFYVKADLSKKTVMIHMKENVSVQELKGIISKAE